MIAGKRKGIASMGPFGPEFQLGILVELYKTGKITYQMIFPYLKSRLF